MNYRVKIYISILTLLILGIFCLISLKDNLPKKAIQVNSNQLDFFSQFNAISKLDYDTLNVLLFDYKCEACKFKIETLNTNYPTLFLAEMDSLGSITYLDKFKILQNKKYFFFYDSKLNFRLLFKVNQLPFSIVYSQKHSSYFYN
jgi:midasin (ATPase involved in ribosome maturation)